MSWGREEEEVVADADEAAEAAEAEEEEAEEEEEEQEEQAAEAEEEEEEEEEEEGGLGPASAASASSASSAGGRFPSILAFRDETPEERDAAVQAAANAARDRRVAVRTLLDVIANIGEGALSSALQDFEHELTMKQRKGILPLTDDGRFAKLSVKLAAKQMALRELMPQAAAEVHNKFVVEQLSHVMPGADSHSGRVVQSLRALAAGAFSGTRLYHAVNNALRSKAHQERRMLAAVMQIVDALSDSERTSLEERHNLSLTHGPGLVRLTFLKRLGEIGLGYLKVTRVRGSRRRAAELAERRPPNIDTAAARPEELEAAENALRSALSRGDTGMAFRLLCDLGRAEPGLADKKCIKYAYVLCQRTGDEIPGAERNPARQLSHFVDSLARLLAPVEVGARLRAGERERQVTGLHDAYKAHKRFCRLPLADAFAPESDDSDED